VKHQRGGGNFCWTEHAFRIHVDVENGEFRCECRQWEHTSWFLQTKYHFIVVGSCCCFGFTMKYVHVYSTDMLQLISLQDCSVCI
jgi:hypothetical protein